MLPRILFILLLTISSTHAGETLAEGDLSVVLAESWQPIQLLGPDGFHPILGPPFFDAHPSPPDGRDFSITEKRRPLMPVPAEFGSQYEMGAWREYEREFCRPNGRVITHQAFATINGIPFQILDTAEIIPAGQLFTETVFTAANGKVYTVSAGKIGSAPDTDPDLQAMLHSIAFVEPPRISRFQKLVPFLDYVFGLPLLLVGLGLGGWLLLVRRSPNVALLTKTNLGQGAAIVLLLNAWFVTGIGSPLGMLCLLLAVCCFRALDPVYREKKARDAQAGLPPPPRQNPWLRVYVFLGSTLVALLWFDFKAIFRGESADVIVVADLGTLTMVGLIFWFLRRRLFPPPDPPPYPDQKIP